MSFPEKLPFTAWAVGLAAAFQAAESSTSFKAACVWCLVILAAAVETILLFLRPVDWKKSQKWTAGLLAMATVFSLVVWGVAVPAYRKEFLTEDMRVNFSVPDLGQIGTDKLALNYFISNKSLSSIVVQEIVAFQIATTDFSNPDRHKQLCELRGLPQSMTVWKTSLHPGRKALHVSLDKPFMPAAEKMFGYEGDLPFQDDGTLDVAEYNPKTLLENGRDLASGAISIDAGKAISLAASFDTDAAAWDTHNVVVVCGAIQYLRSDGRAAWAVCPAAIVARLPQPHGAASSVILRSAGGPCGVPRP